MYNRMNCRKIRLKWARGKSIRKNGYKLTIKKKTTRLLECTCCRCNWENIVALTRWNINRLLLNILIISCISRKIGKVRWFFIAFPCWQLATFFRERICIFVLDFLFPNRFTFFSRWWMQIGMDSHWAINLQ